MALFQWDPWWDFRTRHSDLSDLLRAALPFERNRLRSAQYPPMNICSTDEDVQITLEVPGVKSDEIDISITDDTLTITGSKERPQEANYERRERYSGSFTRAIQVPEDVVHEEIQAALSDGVLTLTLRKAPRARKRQISIEAQTGK